MTFATRPGQARPRPRLARLAEAWRQAPRFVRNAAVSLPTFLFDLALLYLLVHLVRMSYLAATVLSFLVGAGLSYVLARALVFKGTRRGVRTGFVYFLVIAIVSALALTPVMWLLVGLFHLHVMLSRVVAACVVGAGGYLLNLLLNFRPRAGQPEVGTGSGARHALNSKCPRTWRTGPRRSPGPGPRPRR